ncbi:MAG: LysR substrate-binding domain-containing protein [Pseudomonadota bacterium]
MSAKAVSLRGLRTFCVAAKNESFSAAADELFITPSAVSHQIKNLEEELGLKLFERGARELKLTGAGQGMYAEVSPLLTEIDTIVGSYRNSEVRSTVRMSVQPFFASEFFLPRLTEFNANHPDVDIKVSASDESAEHHPTDADLAIRLYRAPPQGVESQLLFPLRFAPAGAKSLADELTIENGAIVGDFPMVIHESYPKAWQQWSRIADIGLPAGGKVTRLDSMIAVVRAVEQGIGAALVPVPVANQWFSSGGITRLFDTELAADVSYFLIWQQDRLEKPAVAALRDWILQRFGTAA